MLHYLFIDIVTQADATTDRHAGSKEVDGPVFLQAGPVTDGLLGIYPRQQTGRMQMIMRGQLS